MVTLGRAALQEMPRTNDWYGTSQDTKPTESVRNGDTYYEMDTQKVYMYDAEAKLWREQ